MNISNPKIVENPHTLSGEVVIKELHSNSTTGLSMSEVKTRIEKYGKNEIPKEKPKTRWRILADQFINSIIYILMVAAFLALIFKDWLEGFAIIIVILITVFIGFFMELQAVRSLESLRQMGQSITSVLRNGKIFSVKASLLVPGDIILLDRGDVITVDARVISEENLNLKEATLTGESAFIEKNINILPLNTPITERSNMVFKGTIVTAGNGQAIVTSTGIHTELGKIQQLSLSAKKDSTPLEKKIHKLSKWLIWLTLVLTVFIVVAGCFKGHDIVFMLQTGIALAVASIPEGLPIVATIALAQGMFKLSKRQVVIKKLEAVQTLGATNIICTDKTGTLTEDQMKVHTLVFESGLFQNLYPKNKDLLESFKGFKAFEKMIMVGVLCNNTNLKNRRKNGDSIDLALIEFAEYNNFQPISIQKNNPKIMEVAFNTERKMMATANEYQHAFNVYAKGAFESIVECCNTILTDGEIKKFNNKEHWYKRVDELASQGLRVLAFAYKDSKTIPKYETLMQQLTFIGLIGFMDPARKDVKPTIEIYKNAGIRVVMMTGDHIGTAKKIAQEIGLLAINASEEKVCYGSSLIDFEKMTSVQKKKLLNVDVFARVTPKQKLDILTLFQQHNNIVGMIGDGINDVPALKKADIGIAMGIRGTEAARESADVILKDDKFTTIELALRQGRTIFENIRQFVVYLLSSNLAEIISVGTAALLNLPSPLLPLQILFLNLITDIFPALALGLGKGDSDVMNKSPRNPNEPIMTSKLWGATVVYGLCITAGVLGITVYSNFVLKLSSAEINNLAFLTLIFAQLLNVFNLPKNHLSFFKNEVTTNRWIWIAIVLCILLTLAAYFTPPIAEALSLISLTFDKLVLVIIFGLGSLLLTQIIKRLGGTV